MSLQPREIFIDLCGVDNEQKLPCGSAVEDQIIDYSAATIQHERILRLANLKGRHAVGEQRVKPFRRLQTPDEELAHMRNIENPAILANRAVLIQDTRVLNRHLPPCEIHHSRARGNMFFVKG